VDYCCCASGFPICCPNQSCCSSGVCLLDEGSYACCNSYEDFVCNSTVVYDPAIGQNVTYSQCCSPGQTCCGLSCAFEMNETCCSYDGQFLFPSAPDDCCNGRFCNPSLCCNGHCCEINATHNPCCFQGSCTFVEKSTVCPALANSVNQNAILAGVLIPLLLLLVALIIVAICCRWPPCLFVMLEKWRKKEKKKKYVLALKLTPEEIKKIEDNRLNPVQANPPVPEIPPPLGPMEIVFCGGSAIQEKTLMVPPNWILDRVITEYCKSLGIPVLEFAFFWYPDKNGPKIPVDTTKTCHENGFVNGTRILLEKAEGNKLWGRNQISLDQN